MSWNNQNVARLRELWDQGLPTAQIGKLLGFTKNAVVGNADILLVPNVETGNALVKMMVYFMGACAADVVLGG